MPIPEHTIDEILERVDLVALVGRHVELKKSGKSFKGRCPFHQEKSASFYVTPELKRFKCFGCQVGGDAIAFVQRYLGKTFVDAVRDLAREVGVDLSAAEDPSARDRQHLREVTELALEHFKSQLWHSTEGKVAREALAARGVGEETARSFVLGWAPEAWSRLADMLLARGLLEFGLGQRDLLPHQRRQVAAHRGEQLPDGAVVLLGPPRHTQVRVVTHRPSSAYPPASTEEGVVDGSDVVPMSCRWLSIPGRVPLAGTTTSASPATPSGSWRRPVLETPS